MSNVLKVSHQEAIRSLYQKGWSQRRIGRELGINRRTVRRYIEGEAKCTTISIPGAETVAGKQPAVLVAEPWGRRSRCEPFEAAIDAKMKAGLSAQRIYQDLVGGEWLYGFLPVGQALRAPTEGEATRAGVAHGMPARRGDAGRFLPGSSD